MKSKVRVLPGTFKRSDKMGRKPTSSEYIRVGKSKIHNKGVFAKKNISKGTKIIQYVGNKITSRQADDIYNENYERHEKNPKQGAVYLFELNKRYHLDGNVSWNTAKYINHSCEPNCEADIIKGEVWVIALRDIKKGEELFYNYGYDVDTWEDHPCKCGSKKCPGYIVEEDQWPKLKRILAKRKKK